MLVVGLPKIVVNDNGVYKRQEVQTWDKSTAKCYVDELIMTKDAFIECYNKWIKNPNSNS